MRLFIAVRLSPEMEEAVSRLQDRMKRQGFAGNYPPPRNLHVTLAFIGEYPSADRVLEAMENVSFPPFALRLSGVGAFGDLWWAGLNESPEMEALVRRLRHALSDAGIPFDRKKFTPHITLARKVRIPEGKRMPDAPEEACMTVEGISLMESVRGKTGMIYTEKGRVPADREDKEWNGR